MLLPCKHRLPDMPSKGPPLLLLDRHSGMLRRLCSGGFCYYPAQWSHSISSSFPHAHPLPLVYIASLSLVASAYHSPKFPCNLDLAGPLVAPFTCQLDSVWWISVHLSTSSTATNHFILLNFSWFTFWKEDTDRSGLSFQTRMAQVAGQPMNLLALAQVWGLEPALGRQMGTRG